MPPRSAWPEEWRPGPELTPEALEDGREYHRALYHDGDVARPRSWHRENVERLVELVLPELERGSIVLDYASGTGGSALPLLDASDARGLDLELALTDVMPSWFAQAHHLLGTRSGAHFFLLDLRQERPLASLFGPERFDVVVSASTIHLLPPRKLGAIFAEVFDILRPGGALVFNSGDLDSPVRELDRAAPLHCVYRRAREHLHATERYQEALQQLVASDRDAHRRVLKGHAVFPEPLDLQLVHDTLEEAGFRREHIEHRVILKSRADARDFAQVSRLTATAGALPDLAERRTLIAAGLEHAWDDLCQERKADPDAVRTFWTFGVYRK